MSVYGRTNQRIMLNHKYIQIAAKLTQPRDHEVWRLNGFFCPTKYGTIVGGWTSPLWNIIFVKMGSSSPGVRITHISETQVIPQRLAGRMMAGIVGLPVCTWEISPKKFGGTLRITKGLATCQSLGARCSHVTKTVRKWSPAFHHHFPNTTCRRRDCCYPETWFSPLWKCFQTRYQRENHHKHWTGWWFQPLWKILVKMGIFPNFRGENKKYLKPPSSSCLVVG